MLELVLAGTFVGLTLFVLVVVLYLIRLFFE
jgi:hypothetical protein